MQTMRSDLAGCPVIIGGGLAGLMTALRLAPRPVILLAKVPLSEGAASAWAQGGIAAAVGEDDRPALHAADTLAAGDGLSDPAVASRIAAAAPAAIIELERHGVVFDRDPAGRLALGLEAAHARRRIVHVAGDGTGAAIMRALVAAVQATPSITVIEGLEARRLLVDDRGIAGVLAAGPVRRLPAAEPPGRAGDRRAGRALCPHHQPAGRHRPGPGAGRAGRRGAGRHGVRAVPSHRARCRARSHAAGQRGRARRGRGAGRRDRRALHGGPRAAASSSRATSSRAPWRRTSRPAIASSSMPGRRSARTSPGTSPASPRAAGPPASIPCASRSPCGRRCTTTWAASPRTPRAAAPSRACGPAARSRQAACTAPIAWPAIRCSRRWSWRARWPTASSAPSRRRCRQHGRSPCRRRRT